MVLNGIPSIIVLNGLTIYMLDYTCGVFTSQILCNFCSGDVNKSDYFYLPAVSIMSSTITATFPLTSPIRFITCKQAKCYGTRNIKQIITRIEK